MMDLICYLSYGYPTIESSKAMAQHYVEAGCDIIEMDFPARDPFLESPYLADRMQAALKTCDDYEQYMQGMADIKRALPDTRFILLVYGETILEIGYERFMAFCRENDFTDMILIDPHDLKQRFIVDGMGVSCYVRFQMLEQEIESAKRSNGFVYMQGKPTDGEINPAFPTLNDCIDHLRATGIVRPIYCGVGIHTPQDAQMARESGADGVFIGSAILKQQDDIPTMKQTIQTFKAAILH